MSTPSDEFTEPEQEQPAEQDEIIYPVSTLPQLSPETRGEANGGPLGCCLGTITGLLLGALLALGIPLWLTNSGYYKSLTALTMCLGIIIGGYIGWKGGKRFYKEYAAPVIKIKRQDKK